MPASIRGSKALALRGCGARILLTAFLFLPPGAAIAADRPSAPEYRLNLYETHTNERIDIVYRKGDSYIPEAIDRLDRFLRDHRTGNMRTLDPRVFDLLYDVSASLGHAGREIDIVCGYRTPSSNEFLRRTTSGVAKHSRHIEGQAIDIRIPGVSTARLRDTALALGLGGVGYYPKSAFVHVDVGPVRHW
jgi:uncharacterized protein YcbK (DUF882 family)